jgi:hypothetical protein
LIPEYAIGYLGKTLNATGLSTTPFQLFKGLDGDMSLQNFTASVLVQNYVGATGRLTVKHMEAENIFNGRKQVLSATPLGSPIDVGPPAFQRDAYTEKRITLDANNSNIKSFVETLPQLIHYNMDVETNPNGNTSNYKDFVFDNSRVDVFLRLETPATFGIQGITLRDTQALDLEAIHGDERLKSAILYVDIDNGYPFEVGLELGFMDENFQLLGYADVDGNQTILPGKTDAQGRPLTSSKTRLTIRVPKEKIAMLQNAKSVLIKANIKGDGKNRKLYNTYQLKINTSGEFAYEVQL